MQKSASTGSLAAAGAASFAHVPKRAAQHGIFLASWEVAPTDLKPGQTSLQRQVYAEEAKRLPDTYINAGRPADSCYGTEHSKLLTPDAYKSPTQPIKQKQPQEGFGHHSAAHWKSTSHATFHPSSIAGAVYHRQNGPSYQQANPPTCVGQPLVDSTYAEYHGKYGEDPRDRVHPEARAMPAFQNTLTIGTHKGTKHVPGYSGFIASNIANPHVARVASGSLLRSVDKTNLTEQFHTNVLNYSGHIPTNPHNDTGGVKPNNQTMMGRSFTTPMLNCFD